MHFSIYGFRMPLCVNRNYFLEQRILTDLCIGEVEFLTISRYLEELCLHRVKLRGIVSYETKNKIKNSRSSNMRRVDKGF